MCYVQDNRFNPNPITKLFVVALLGLTVTHSVNHYSEWAAIFVISAMFFINGFKKEAIQNIMMFGILFFAPNFTILMKLPLVLKMIFSLLFIIRMFYIPYIAGKFLVKTSDVGSIISSMDFLKIPNAISIPIAVMFRFFPSFVEEKNHIKMAMKIRGIQTKNPIQYFEYVAVPLLIISSNIADDIAKAAETKCIANPVRKTRYISIAMQRIDFIYAVAITAIVVGGWICSH